MKSSYLRGDGESRPRPRRLTDQTRNAIAVVGAYRSTHVTLRMSSRGVIIDPALRPHCWTKLI